MKTTKLFLTAACAFCLSTVAFAQTTPTTTTPGTVNANPGSVPGAGVNQGTMQSGNTTTDMNRGTMNGTGTMQNGMGSMNTRSDRKTKMNDRKTMRKSKTTTTPSSTGTM